MAEPLLSKEDLIERARPKRGTIDVEGLGRLAAKTWTWDEIKYAGELRRHDDSKTARGADAWLISRSLLKSLDGPPMFDDSDVHMIGSMDADAVSSLIGEIAKLSDVDAEAVVRAGEASAETKASGSTSG